MPSTISKYALDSKLPKVGTTIFSLMSKLAQECQAINLSQGFPDFECHPELIEGVTHYMKQGANQYCPTAGLPALREQIALKTERDHGISIDPETEITVHSGASEAIFNIIAAVVKADDEVIIFEPAYDLYKPVIELFEGKVVPISLNAEDFSLDWEKARTAITPKTRLLIINTPHNPSGTTLKAKDMQTLTDLVKDTPILVIGDEVYEHIIFDGKAHQSVLRYPELRERSFAVFSFGKTFHVTGWRVGYCIAPPALTNELRKIHQYNTFSTFTPAQYALADFLKDETHYQELPSFYQARRDKIREWLSDTAFKLLPCEGTYFQTVSYGHLSQENDIEYAQRLTREVGVATIPFSPFYTQAEDHKHLRFCFAKKYETMEQAMEKLIRFEDKLKQG
jgi:methionine aminotransferase